MSAAAKRRPSPPVEIDIVVDSALWSACTEAEAVVLRAIEAAALAAGKPGAVAVLLTHDAAIQAMNAQWRGIDKPTNVLSFPAAESAAASGTAHLGDIAIAYETVAAESITENKSFADHLAHLAVHGYLHLVGFDHEADVEAVRMEHLETQILSGLGIVDPYADQTAVS